MIGLLQPIPYLLAALLFALTPSRFLAGPVVKVYHQSGHGSGSHLGNGFILTAAHVVDGETGVKVLDDHQHSHPAEIVLLDKANDVAVLKIDPDAKLQTASLSCRVPNVGEAVHATGNPYNLEFITTWGRVAGRPLALGGLVQSAMVLDMTILPGMSGGPVRDWWGRIVGISTATMLQPPLGSIIPISYSVPGSTICAVIKPLGI